ncbi:MDR family MFS transporter [Yinghuangia seranimata]|uniref:MDR family MFS transporter n=1 Tax=Yinghuangia seranimata TaxID=408067 RepID=UPI00248AACE2|nr:MDR family MFS transporter [Yinghuangia seranimata]MDI2132169.1 MDR family MFS transporter [Yinghuangia seranimata]
MPVPRPSQKAVVSIVFVVAMFMTVLDSTIVNVALPSIASDYHEAPSSVAGVNVGFLVSLAVFISAAGWLGDRFGVKRVFLFALAVFTAASALCGLAQDLPQLVGFRVLQGIGGGLLTPVGMAMMMRTYPPAERMRASRVLIIPTALAPSLGPIVGGLMVDHASWHWVFYMNVPVGVAALVFGALYLDERREPDTGPFDLPGFACAGLGLAATLYALTEGAQRGWTSPVILGTATGGVLLLVLLVVVESRNDQPMLDLRLLRDRLFLTSTMVTVTASAGFLGTVFVLPIMIQRARGLEATDSGLTTFPTAVGIVLATQLVARYYPKVGPRRLTAAGLAGVSLMIALLGFVGPDTSLWWVRADLFVTGLFLANVFMPSQTAAFATVPMPRMGNATTLFNVQRQLGAAVGVAVLGSVLAGVGIFTGTGAAARPNYTAYHWAFAAAAAMAAVGVVFALFTRDSDAAATMAPPADTGPDPASDPAPGTASGHDDRNAPGVDHRPRSTA